MIIVYGLLQVIGHPQDVSLVISPSQVFLAPISQPIKPRLLDLLQAIKDGKANELHQGVKVHLTAVNRRRRSTLSDTVRMVNGLFLQKPRKSGEEMDGT